MADETPGTGETKSEGASGGAAGSEQRGVTIHTQYIKDLSVENPNAPQVFVEMKEAPNVSVNLDVTASRLQETAYEVILTADIKATIKEKTGFIIELKYGALVSVDQSIDGDRREAALLIETPRHLFPFARAIVAGASRDAGYPPLLINPVDFTRLYRDQKARFQAQQQQQGQQSTGEAQQGAGGDGSGQSSDQAESKNPAT